MSRVAAQVSLATSMAALLCLVALHVLSPEFDPSWRVVSEYALGRHGWALSSMFIMWAVSSWALAYAVRPQMKTIGGRAGLVLLVVAGVGEALAAVFDLRRPALHGLAGALGMPSLPVAALLISLTLARRPQWSATKDLLLWMAILTWMSFLSVCVAMLTLTRRIGGLRLPIGWPNRLLVAIYLAWAIAAAWPAMQVNGDDIGDATRSALP